jgi:lipid-A-disaccharide synthase
VKVVFYVSPQVWAWRAGRAKTIAELAEKVICLLPFEPALYPDGKAVFLGSPVAERCPRLAEPGSEAWCLAPGSRQQEIERLLPVMLEATEGHERVLAAAPGVSLECDVRRIEGLSLAARECKVALVASGTATLELACLGRPMVVIYRVAALTYTVARALVDVPYIALPNLILGRQVVPEFVQDLDPAVLRQAMEVAEGGQDLDEVRAALWPEGAGKRIADLVRGHL